MLLLPVLFHCIAFISSSEYRVIIPRGPVRDCSFSKYLNYFDSNDIVVFYFESKFSCAVY